MRKRTNIALYAFLTVFFVNALSFATTDNSAQGLQQTFRKVAKIASPSVVNIQIVQEQNYRVIQPEFFFFGIPDDSPVYKYKMEGTGSGVIVDEKGYIVTNAHVVNEATEIKVTRTTSQGKDRIYKGRVIGIDHQLDIAVIKIDTKEKLPYLEFADSASTQVGDWAIAIGSPFGLKQTLTVGVVSAVRQSLEIQGIRFHNLIQTDASINRGNSGGPLLNLDGKIIGINSAIYSPSGASAGIGFAIPAGEIKLVLEDLKAGKEIKKGWLGIQMQALDEVMVDNWDLPIDKGVIVESVIENSPAHKAGLKRSDIIVSCNDREVETPMDLAQVISLNRAGAVISLKILRDKRFQIVKVKLGVQPDELDSLRPVFTQATPSDITTTWEGVTFSQRNDMVFISEVDYGSKLGNYLEVGDEINSINRHKINSVSDLKAALESASLEKGMVFDITRNNTPMYVSVQIK
jgi:serine protease Do